MIYSVGPKINELLIHDPSTWHTLQIYHDCRDVVKNICIVNDCAERGVKLIKDFNEFGTRSESQKQNMMSVVEYARKTVPKPTKKNIENLRTDSTFF